MAIEIQHINELEYNEDAIGQYLREMRLQSF